MASCARCGGGDLRDGVCMRCGARSPPVVVGQPVAPPSRTASYTVAGGLVLTEIGADVTSGTLADLVEPAPLPAEGIVLTELPDDAYLDAIDPPEPEVPLLEGLEMTRFDDPGRAARRPRAAGAEPAPRPKGESFPTAACPSCGSALPQPTPSFCDACGERLPRARRAGADAKGGEPKRCGRCGLKNPADRSACSNCGDRI